MAKRIQDAILAREVSLSVGCWRFIFGRWARSSAGLTCLSCHDFTFKYLAFKARVFIFTAISADWWKCWQDNLLLQDIKPRTPACSFCSKGCTGSLGWKAVPMLTSSHSSEWCSQKRKPMESFLSKGQTASTDQQEGHSGLKPLTHRAYPPPPTPSLTLTLSRTNPRIWPWTTPND